MKSILYKIANFFKKIEVTAFEKLHIVKLCYIKDKVKSKANFRHFFSYIDLY